MSFTTIKNNLLVIANKGNYVDLINTLTLLCAYAKTFGTGHVNNRP